MFHPNEHLYLEGDTDAFFNQTSIYQHDGNTTFNTGFGYRNLFNDKKIIFGINAFYDREIKVTHQRVGLGIGYYLLFLI